MNFKPSIVFTHFPTAATYNTRANVKRIGLSIAAFAFVLDLDLATVARFQSYLTLKEQEFFGEYHEMAHIWARIETFD